MSTYQPQSEYDVIIVGGGPAGMMASLCLTTYGFNILQIDDRPEPTKAGRADGIQPRTIEVLRNIGGVSNEHLPGGDIPGIPKFGESGIAKNMIKQGVRVYEVAFWDPTETEKLARTSRAPSCPEFVDVVDNYTLLLHQGLIENAFMNETEARRQQLPLGHPKAPTGGVFRPFAFVSCETHDETSNTHPVEATIQHVDTKQIYKVKAKYLLGCDGARSLVRRCIAGGEPGDGEWKGKIQMQGEATDIIWGVMDARVHTNFPDLKFKCLIHSKSEGSIMVIPRENGLVRFYVQLQESEGGEIKSIDRNKATQDICIARARKIFEPYHLEFGYIDWFSVYQIGQRIASKYTLDHRVFLGGDATHTHSPKAGQGMNISMLDMYSLAWKLNLVMKGLGKPEILLPTYEHERRGVAEELLAFDSEYSRLFSGRSPKSDQLTEVAAKAKASGAVDATKFIEVFKKNAFFTSGCGAIYFANPLNALPDADVIKNNKSKYARAFNPAGIKLKVGQRLTPGKVTRCEDGNQVRLQQEVKMNGAFRIHIFAGDYPGTKSQLDGFANFIDSPGSFFNKYRPASGVFSSIVDGPGPQSSHLELENSPHKMNPFFTFLIVVASNWYDWEISDLPSPLRLYRNQVYGDSIFDKRVPEAGVNAPLHYKFGINRSKGAIVVVRPDSYVGAITELSEDGWH